MTGEFIVWMMVGVVVWESLKQVAAVLIMIYRLDQQKQIEEYK